MSFPNGVYVSLAAAIKAAVPELPVLHAGRIVDPVHADQLLAEGAVDVVGMTRALIADAEMPRKAREGRLDDIRQCVGANEGCIDRIYQAKPVTCIQNPVTSREPELGEIVPARSPKRVVVVGGGVAGLEAARVAALRGHQVTLFEREAEVGGQVLVAARAPARADYAGIVRFLMTIPDPSPEIVAAVEGAMAWFKQRALHGVAWDRRATTGTALVERADAPDLWARFYEFGTGRPIFGERDRTVHYVVTELSGERRLGEL